MPDDRARSVFTATFAQTLDRHKAPLKRHPLTARCSLCYFNSDGEINASFVFHSFRDNGVQSTTEN